MCRCVQRDGRVIAGSLQSDRKPSCDDLDGMYVCLMCPKYLHAGHTINALNNAGCHNA